MRDDVAQRKPLSLDSTLMVDPTILEVEARTCAPSMEQAGISAPSDVLYSTTVPTASVSTTVVPTLRPFPSPITHPPLTHTLIYQTGIFARSTSVRATRVEMDIPKIICRAIEKALTPLIDREWSSVRDWLRFIRWMTPQRY